MSKSTRALRGASVALRMSSAQSTSRSLSNLAALRPRPAQTSSMKTFRPTISTFRPSPIAGPSSLRTFTTSPVRNHGDLKRPEPGTGIKVTYQDSKGNVIKTVEGNEGDDLLSLAHEHDIDLEGACERSVACSTCHVIISPEYYDLLPDPEDDENDMLDLAFGLEDTSRLGCQVLLKKELDGIVARLPSATRNMYVDGAKARTH